jgi:hypothetical protein
MTHEIPLPDGRVARVDAADAALVAGYRWRAHRSGRLEYVIAYHQSAMVRLHRHVLTAPSDRLVDHINGDTFDNRRGNLRLTDWVGNSANRCGVGACPYRGVIFDRSKNRWRARLEHCGKRRHLGWFSTPEDAAAAWDEAAFDLHGDMARLNFP